jgi:hypothetical protein
MREAKEKAPFRGRRSALMGIAATALLAVAGCARDLGPHPDLPFLLISAGLTSQNLCGLGVSPRINLPNAPANAVRYRFKMTLVSALSGPTWETDVPATGNIIPEGALNDFPAPCPPEIQNYSYRVEMMAYDANDKPLAYGWNFWSTRSLARQVYAEQSYRRANPNVSLNSNQAAQQMGLVPNQQSGAVVAAPGLRVRPGQTTLVDPAATPRPPFFLY